MEKSWDTAYLWENAEAALAYFEAAADTRDDDPARSRQYELDGLVILRAIARHHYGPHGFLTEGVDWNNHVGQEHHIGQARFAAIRYTEPFLNNQHIAEPTLFYLRRLAVRCSTDQGVELRDLEGHVLHRGVAAGEQRCWRGPRRWRRSGLPWPTPRRCRRAILFDCAATPRVERDEAARAFPGMPGPWLADSAQAFPERGVLPDAAPPPIATTGGRFFPW
jgi:hypothetical protein